jgi:Leucine-rich repeat (LRR) protein
MENFHVCNRSGVTCVGAFVTEINLSNNNLSGTILDSFSALTGIQYLSLSGNHISTVSNTIDRLTNLDTIDLSYNSLTEFPKIPVLTNLHVLNLSNNSLTALPDQIGSLIGLNTLDLSHNLLSGTLPDEINNLTNLNTLNINDNQFSGTLPIGIGNLINLDTLNLSNNQFSGALPAPLIQLLQSNPSLILNFDISNNI